MEKKYRNLKYRVEGKSITIIGYTNVKVEILEIPETIEGMPVTRIGAAAFWECDSLVDIKLPEGLTEVGKRVFARCTSLVNIKLPESLIAVGLDAFKGCSGLQTITMPKSLKDLGCGAFAGCSSLTAIAIPKGLTKVENWVFSECSSLNSVILPEGIVEIGFKSFERCSDLVEIIMPESLKKLGLEAFSGCSSLTTVMMPQALTELTFGEVVKVSTTIITMPEDWRDAIDWGFNGCTSLVEVCVSKGTKGGKIVFENPPLQFDKKQYIDKVIDGIKLDSKKKSEIHKRLEEEIDNRVRRGEALEIVLSQMGSAKARAKDFNERLYKNREN